MNCALDRDEVFSLSAFLISSLLLTSSKAPHAMLVIYFIGSLLASLVSARNAADLIGTWTTKSRQVFTGPVCLSVTCRLFVGADGPAGVLRCSQG